MKSKTSLPLDIFHLHIAGYCIEINCTAIDDTAVRKNFIQSLYQHYYPYLFFSCARESDFTIHFDATKEILVEKKVFNEKQTYMMHFFSLVQENQIRTFYHISISQMQLLLKIVIQKLLGKNTGFFLHCSSVLDPHKNQLYLFTGPNEAGKSTMISGLQDIFTPFSDDVLIIKRENKRWVGYQMPLDLKGYPYTTSEAYSIDAVSILSKSKHLKLISLSKEEIDIKSLLEQVIGGMIYRETLKDFFSFVHAVPHIYNIYFPKHTTGTQFKKCLMNHHLDREEEAQEPVDQ